jgi:hypothetical protein
MTSDKLKVKFEIQGEKQLIFPDAFVGGFLKES